MRHIKKIVAQSTLDLAFINKSNGARELVKKMALTLKYDDIWVIKAWGDVFDFKSIVDFLYHYDLDVFDIEEGSVTYIYVCQLDAYKIEDAVVHRWKRGRSEI